MVGEDDGIAHDPSIQAGLQCHGGEGLVCMHEADALSDENEAEHGE